MELGLKKPTILAIALFILVSNLFSSDSKKPLSKTDNQAIGILENYCIDCHDEETKKGNFDLALKVGKPVARKTIQLENEYLVSECPLAGVHINQGVQKIDKKQTIKTLSHPIEIIEKSLFKPEES